MYRKFHQAYENRHEYARAYPGRGVLGYMCTYAPEEVAYAAGLLPVRIVGAHEPESVTAPHIFNMFCAYCRDILAQGLTGKYDYIKGVVHVNCCEKIRNAYDSWLRHVPDTHGYYMFMPQYIWHKGAVAAFRQEVDGFRRSLEQDWGVSVGDSEMDRAIEVYNENRGLMRQVYKMMQEEHPRILGEELMAMGLSNQVMDKVDHSRLIREFLVQVEGRSGESAVRTMVIGQTDDLGLAQLLDSMGARVVVDENCFGLRYFWDQVESGGDPLTAIATRYVERAPCPVKDAQEPRHRTTFVTDLAKQYGVALAIIIYPKFCDPHGYDSPVLTEALQGMGVEVLELEQDFTIPLGQFRTRIEAFLEMLTVEDL
ncbi:MAG: 2-hydroxyacyl-CoA dehydratase [Dehalococcoidia bacterium]|nr:2-hydroxyacyl-CoA dehydratase [Dehalococcoidia bacterium]